MDIEATVDSNHSSGAVWESRWPSWAVRPNKPSGFRGRKELLNRVLALVSACPYYVNRHLRTLSNTSPPPPVDSSKRPKLYFLLLVYRIVICVSVEMNVKINAWFTVLCCSALPDMLHSLHSSWGYSVPGNLNQHWSLFIIKTGCEVRMVVQGFKQVVVGDLYGIPHTHIIPRTI